VVVPCNLLIVQALVLLWRLDIKTLATGFQTCLFKHYVRKINAAAHVLAL
jgi:hypothetical protein